MATDDIRARLEACPIPEDARSDWDGTNHYEIQTPYGDTWTWLDVGDVFGAKPDDYSDTEEGQLLGSVLDYACHYARDVSALLRANEALAKALRGQQCKCPVLLECPHCGGRVVEGVDQFSDSWICGVCVKTVDLPKDPARQCVRCAALAQAETGAEESLFGGDGA